MLSSLRSVENETKFKRIAKNMNLFDFLKRGGEKAPLEAPARAKDLKKENFRAEKKDILIN